MAAATIDAVNYVPGATEGNDELKGTPRQDEIRGLGGDDVIYGMGSREKPLENPQLDAFLQTGTPDYLYGAV